MKEFQNECNKSFANTYTNYNTKSNLFASDYSKVKFINLYLNL